MLPMVLAACPGPVPSGVPTPDPPGFEVRVRPLVCGDPAARSAGAFERVPLDLPPPARQYLWAAAAAAGDVDGDGWIDVIALSEAGPVLFRNPGWEAEPLADLGLPMGAALADLDGDGDLDLYVARHAAPDALLRNDGTGSFTDASDALVGNAARNTSSVSFADIDGDGDLDGLALSVGDFVDDATTPVRHFPPSAPAHLWVNQGDGTFVDRGDTLPEAVHAGFSLAGGLHDLDGDGLVDLYAVNDFGGAHGANAWAVGDGAGGFALPAAGHGLDVATTGMGLGVGDVNGDGVDDVAIAYWGGVRVLESAPGPLWFDTTLQRMPAGFAIDDVAWGGDLEDLDNDGDLDLFVSFAHVGFENRWPNPERQDDRLWLGGPGAWEEVGAEWGLADGSVTRGAVLADLDDDGWLDLIRPSQDDPVLLISRCGAARGLRVALEQAGPNRFAIGARVAIASAGAPTARTVRAGGTSYGSAGPPEVHFGVGADEVVDLEITWPDGTRSSHPAIPTASHVTIVRPDAASTQDLSRSTAVD
ncbi:MAG: CRTAC1 family protein [Alphaproteobacteria bacterium]|nr:CRTAC1 family protein [Alphaproteobacteria bacterium]